MRYKDSTISYKLRRQVEKGSRRKFKMNKSTKTIDSSNYILPTQVHLYGHATEYITKLTKEGRDKSSTRKVVHSYTDWTHTNQENCVDSVHEIKPFNKSIKKINSDSTKLSLQSSYTQIKRNDTKSEMCQLKHNIFDKGKVKMMQFRNVFNNITNGLKLSKGRVSADIPDTKYQQNKIPRGTRAAEMKNNRRKDLLDFPRGISWRKYHIFGNKSEIYNQRQRTKQKESWKIIHQYQDFKTIWHRTTIPIFNPQLS